MSQSFVKYTILVVAGRRGEDGHAEELGRRAMYLYCYLQLSVIDKFILGMEGIRCQQEMRFQVIPPDGGWPSGRGGGRTAHARPSPA